jgi:hypothetical protein
MKISQERYSRGTRREVLGSSTRKIKFNNSVNCQSKPTGQQQAQNQRHCHRVGMKSIKTIDFVMSWLYNTSCPDMLIWGLPRVCHCGTGREHYSYATYRGRDVPKLRSFSPRDYPSSETMRDRPTLEAVIAQTELDV